jgi:toxin-antitoxin system PIN domain toxin
MNSSVFPDINVWLALTLLTHEHHAPAWNWYTSLPQDVDLVFCRITQLGLLRLLTTKAVAAEATMTQQGAWTAYDAWMERGGGLFKEEPPWFDDSFRAHSDRDISSPKEWADAYLAAFAETASLTLVTFDKALAAKAKGSTLLGR